MKRTKSLEIKVTKVIDNKDLVKAIDVLTYPTKDDTAKNHGCYIFIHSDQALVWRVFKSDVPLEYRDKLIRMLKEYE